MPQPAEAPREAPQKKEDKTSAIEPSAEDKATAAAASEARQQTIKKLRKREGKIDINAKLKEIKEEAKAAGELQDAINIGVKEYEAEQAAEKQWIKEAMTGDTAPEDKEGKITFSQEQQESAGMLSAEEKAGLDEQQQAALSEVKAMEHQLNAAGIDADKLAVGKVGFFSRLKNRKLLKSYKKAQANLQAVAPQGTINRSAAQKAARARRRKSAPISKVIGQ